MPSSANTPHVVALIADERGARVFEHLIRNSAAWVESPGPYSRDPDRARREVASMIDNLVRHNPQVSVAVVGPEPVLAELQCAPSSRVRLLAEDEDLADRTSTELYAHLSQRVLQH